MALAALCSKFQENLEMNVLRFHGFVVDHRLREGSGDEAMRVAEFLDQLSMPLVSMTQGDGL